MWFAVESEEERELVARLFFDFFKKRQEVAWQDFEREEAARQEFERQVAARQEESEQMAARLEAEIFDERWADGYPYDSPHAGTVPSREETERQEAVLREEFERRRDAANVERIRKSYRDSKDDEKEFPEDGIRYPPQGGDPTKLVVIFPGPTGTPYQEGLFQCRLEFLGNFPFEPPKVSMLTKVWHHFFDLATGAVCADILQDCWSPAISRGPQLVRTIQSLLSEPLSEDSEPLNLKAAILLRDHKSRSDLVARHYTRLYAVLDHQDRPSGNVCLNKKDLNAMVMRLRSEISDDQMQQMLQCIGRVANDYEYAVVADSLAACLANLRQIPYVLHACERRLDGATAVTPLFLESLAELKKLIPDDIHETLTAIVNQLKTHEESRLVESCLAECLVWPSNAAHELTILTGSTEIPLITTTNSSDWWNDESFVDPGRAQVEEPVDFFLSHRGCDSKDNLVQPLHSILGKLGISSFYDKRSIRTGERNELEMARGLYSCRFGVVLITDSFLGSKWCRKELKTLYERHMNAKSGNEYTLHVFFGSQRLFNDPAFKILKSIGAVVRSPGISDRQFLTSELIPTLMKVLGKHNDIHNYVQLLDSYLSNTRVTAHASLRTEARGGSV